MADNIKGTNLEVYIGQGRNAFTMREKQLKAYIDSPVISVEISATATGSTNAVYVPAGSFIERVGIMATGTIATADIDVGDSGDTDRYIDGLTTLSKDNIAWAPIPSPTVAMEEASGHYYSTGTYIAAKVNATGGSTSAFKVIAMYRTDPTSTS